MSSFDYLWRAMSSVTRSHAGNCQCSSVPRIMQWVEVRLPSQTGARVAQRSHVGIAAIEDIALCTRLHEPESYRWRGRCATR